jgi:hypothetical protein
VNTSVKKIRDQTAHGDDQSGFEGTIAELLKLYLPAVRASQLVKQVVRTHLGAAHVAIQSWPFPTSE